MGSPSVVASGTALGWQVRLHWMAAQKVEGLEKSDREAACCPKSWGRSRSETVLPQRKTGGQAAAPGGVQVRTLCSWKVMESG